MRSSGSNLSWAQATESRTSIPASRSQFCSPQHSLARIEDRVRCKMPRHRAPAASPANSNARGSRPSRWPCGGGRAGNLSNSTAARSRRPAPRRGSRPPGRRGARPRRSPRQGWWDHRPHWRGRGCDSCRRADRPQRRRWERCSATEPGRGGEARCPFCCVGPAERRGAAPMRAAASIPRQRRAANSAAASARSVCRAARSSLTSSPVSMPTGQASWQLPSVAQVSSAW